MDRVHTLAQWLRQRSREATSILEREDSMKRPFTATGKLVVGAEENVIEVWYRRRDERNRGDNYVLTEITRPVRFLLTLLQRQGETKQPQ